MATPYDRILALGKAGQFAEARILCRRLVQKKPGDRRAWLLLGNVELQLGESRAAQTALQRALALGQAEDPEVLGLLGVAHSQTGDWATGIGYLRKALAVVPTAAETRYNLALALQKSGDGAAAQREYERLVQQVPHHGRGWVQLGHLARQQHQWLTAERHYQQALTVEPTLAEAHLHWGMCRWEAQDWAGARQACERAIALQPTAAAHNLLGAIYERLEQAQPALHHYRQALTYEPQQMEARLNLANAYRRLEDFANAAALYQELLQENPHHLSAVDGLLQVRMQICDWDGIAVLWERFWQELPQTPASISPLSALYLPGDAHQQKIVADKVSAGLKQTLAERGDRLPRPTVPPPPPLRLGYLSGDFRYHAVAHLMAGLFAHHDRAQFQVYAYSLGPDDGSEYRQKLQRDADVFRDLRGQTPEAIAQTIHQDQIHILIDLAGYTDYGSPQTLLLRPAPVLVHYLGYPGSLGLTDYLIADPVVVPPDGTSAYLEAIAYLPHCYQINHHQQPVPILGDRNSLRCENGLPPNSIVFCCFNHARKINAEIFAVWMTVLRAVPDSVLWLMGMHPLAQANLRQAAERQGVRGDRLIFAPSQPKAAHLQRLTAADLFLDTPIYNAHTTGSDALWAGVPLLTLRGQTFAARVGESLVRATFPEDWATALVATDLEDYQRRAIALAQDRPRLHEYQRYLHQQRHSLPLFQTAQTVRDLENLYRQMWERHRLGLAPDTLWVSAHPTATAEIPARPQGWAIVIAADSRYFPLAQEAILSIRAFPEGQTAEICYLDLGCTTEQRTWLARHTNRIAQAKWDLDFPGRDTTPDYLKAMVGRPFLPEYFPGYEVYLWLDADAWVQTWEAIPWLVAAAQKYGLAIVSELDRQNNLLFGQVESYMAFQRDWYAPPYGPEVADRLCQYPPLCTGVFAMRYDAPHWQAWRDRLHQGIQRAIHAGIDQISLNLAIYENPDLFAQTALLPIGCDWVCHMGLPLWDEDQRRFVEAQPPYLPISILHLTSFKNHKQVRVKTRRGGEVEIGLRYGTQQPRPVREPVPSPPATSAIAVTATDAKFFALAQGLIRSVRAARPHLPLACLDVGCTPDQRRWLETHVDRVVSPGWDFRFAHQDQAPPYLRALTARPFLDRYFPGWDTYLWLDADTWVQDGTALDLLLESAGSDRLAIVPQLDRSASLYYGRVPALWADNYRWLAGLYGAEVAQKYHRFPLLNNGVFGLGRLAPHWAVWRQCFQEACDRQEHPFSYVPEQTSLNYAVYHHDLWNRTVLLPLWCNWTCHLVLPFWHPEHQQFVEPHWPHHALGIIHLTAQKEEFRQVRTVDGSQTVRSFYYPGAPDRLNLENPLPSVAVPNPNSDFSQIPAWLQEAAQCGQQGRNSEALALCQRVLALDPQNPRALHLSGLALWQSGQAQAALEPLQRAIALEPANPELYSHLGVVHCALGDLGKGVECYAQALALAPHNLGIRFNYALGLHKLGRYDEARQQYEQILQQDANRPQVHFHLGRIHQQFQNAEAARRHYQQALTLDPNCQDAAIALQVLAQTAAKPVPASGPNSANNDGEAIVCEPDAGFVNWMARCGGSLWLTTYQAGKVAVLGWDGRQLTVTMCTFRKAMGLALTGDRLALSTQEEVLLFGEGGALTYGYREDAPGAHDALYLPRARYLTGDLFTHDLAWGADGLWLVNTRFSCLARLSDRFNFVPQWRPFFITDLAPEDRCHLNGLAMVNGQPKYVTALGASDEVGGWRPQKADGGIVMDVERNEVVLWGLSMPHSPVWYDNHLWFHNSGRGELWRWHPETGQITVVAELPGYGRGLALVAMPDGSTYAIAGTCQIREQHIFGGLPIQQRLSQLVCAVLVVDVATGQEVGRFHFRQGCQELYGIQFLPGKTRPALLDPNDETATKGFVCPEVAYWLRPSALLSA